MTFFIQPKFLGIKRAVILHLYLDHFRLLTEVAAPESQILVEPIEVLDQGGIIWLIS